MIKNRTHSNKRVFDHTMKENKRLLPWNKKSSQQFRQSKWFFLNLEQAQRGTTRWRADGRQHGMIRASRSAWHVFASVLATQGKPAQSWWRTPRSGQKLARQLKKEISAAETLCSKTPAERRARTRKRCFRQRRASSALRTEAPAPKPTRRTPQSPRVQRCTLSGVGQIYTKPALWVLNAFRVWVLSVCA